MYGMVHILQFCFSSFLQHKCVVLTMQIGIKLNKTYVSYSFGSCKAQGQRQLEVPEAQVHTVATFIYDQRLLSTSTTTVPIRLTAYRQEDRPIK